jgi:DNA primase large subunit
MWQAAKSLLRLNEGDRLEPILNNLSLEFTAPEYTSTSSVAGHINAAQIDDVSNS